MFNEQGELISYEADENPMKVLEKKLQHKPVFKGKNIVNEKNEYFKKLVIEYMSMYPVIYFYSP